MSSEVDMDKSNGEDDYVNDKDGSDTGSVVEAREGTDYGDGELSCVEQLNALLSSIREVQNTFTYTQNLFMAHTPHTQTCS